MNRDLCNNDNTKPTVKPEKGNQVTTYEQEPTTWIPISENELPEGIINQGVLKVFEYRQVTNQGHSNDVTVIEESCIQEINTDTSFAQTDYFIDKHKYSKEAIKPYFLNYLDLEEKSKESQDLEQKSQESEELEDIKEDSYITATTESSESKVDAQIQVTPVSSVDTIKEYLRNLAEQVRLKAAGIVDSPLLIEPLIQIDTIRENPIPLTCEHPDLSISVEPKTVNEVIVCNSIGSVGNSADNIQKLTLEHIHTREGPIPVNMSHSKDSKGGKGSKDKNKDKDCLSEDCIETCGKIPPKCPENEEQDKVKVVCMDGDLKFKLNCKKVDKCPTDDCGNTKTKYLCKIIPQDDVCVNTKALCSPTLRCSIIHPFIPDIEVDEIPPQEIKPKPFPCVHETEDSKTGDSDSTCKEKPKSSKSKEVLDPNVVNDCNFKEIKPCPYKILCKNDDGYEEMNVAIVDTPNNTNHDENPCPVKPENKKDDSSKGKDKPPPEEKPLCHKKKTDNDSKEVSDTETEVKGSAKEKKPCSHVLKNKTENISSENLEEKKPCSHVLKVKQENDSSEKTEEKKPCAVQLKNKKNFESELNASSTNKETEINKPVPAETAPEPPATVAPIPPSCPPIPTESRIKLVIQKEEDRSCTQEEKRDEGKVEVRTLDHISTEKIIFACRSKTKCKQSEDAEEISCVPEGPKERRKREEKCCPRPSYLTDITNAMAAAHHKTIATIKLAAEDLVNNVASAVYKSKDDCRQPVDKIKQSASNIVTEIKKKAKDADIEKKTENLKETINTGKKTIRSVEKCAADAIIEATNKTKELLGLKDEAEEECKEKNKSKVRPKKTSYSKDNDSDDDMELNKVVRESVEKFYDTVYRSTQEAKIAITDLANQSMKMLGIEIDEDDDEKFYDSVCKTTKDAKNAITDLANQSIKMLGIEIKDEESDNDSLEEDSIHPTAQVIANEVTDKTKKVQNLIDEESKQEKSSAENIMDKIKETKDKLAESTQGLIESGKKYMGLEDMQDLKRKKQNIKKLLSGLSIFNHIKDKDSDEDSESEQSESLTDQLTSAYNSVRSSIEGLTHVQIADKSSVYDKPVPKDCSLGPSSSAKPPGMLASLKDKLFSIFYDKENSIKDDKESVASIEEALVIRDREDEEDAKRDATWYERYHE